MDDHATILEALRTRNAKEAARIRRWREGKRQTGKKALTIWLPETVKLALEDMALTRHTSPSALLLEAYTARYPHSADMTVTATDTITDTATDIVTVMSQLRTVVEQAVWESMDKWQQYQHLPVVPIVTDTATDTVTDTATDTVTDTATDTVTDTATDTTTKATPAPVPAHVTDTVTDTGDVSEADPPKKGRKPVFRQPILDMLRQYPEGLTAAELKVYLHTDKSLGDTLQGMVKAALIAKHGLRPTVRYTLPATPQATALASA